MVIYKTVTGAFSSRKSSFQAPLHPLPVLTHRFCVPSAPLSPSLQGATIPLRVLTAAWIRGMLGVWVSLRDNQEKMGGSVSMLMFSAPGIRNSGPLTAHPSEWVIFPSSHPTDQGPASSASHGSCPPGMPSWLLFPTEFLQSHLLQAAFQDNLLQSSSSLHPNVWGRGAVCHNPA